MSEKHQESPRLLGFAAAAAILGVFAVWATIPTVESSRGENTRKLALVAAPQTANPLAETTKNHGGRTEAAFCTGNVAGGCASPVNILSNHSAEPQPESEQPDFAADENLSQPSEPAMAALPEDASSVQIDTAPNDAEELAALTPAAGTGNPDQYTARKPEVIVSPATATSNSNPRQAAGKTYFLVIGSFINPAHAKERRKQFAEWKPMIRQKQLKGKSYHRILLGPYDTTKLKQARRRVSGAGIADSWALPVPDADMAHLAVIELPKEG